MVGCSVAGASRPGADAAVARQTIEDVFLLTGDLEAVHSDPLVAPSVEGFQVQIKTLVEDGAEVEAGQLVAELDKGRSAQGLEEMRHRLAQAEIALEERQAALAAEAPQKELDRHKAATEAEKAEIDAAVPAELRSRRDWNDKQQAQAQTRAELQKASFAEETFRKASAAEIDGLKVARDIAARDVHQAEESLRRLQLSAPRAGIVIIGHSWMNDRPFQAGDNVFPGARIASIPDLSAMQVVAFLSEVDDGRVVPGQRARVAFETNLHRVFEGRIESVAAVVEDARYAGGFRVLVSLEKTDAAVMRPGLSARVEVVRRVFTNALVVPRQAVSRTAAGARVRRSGSGTAVDVKIAECLPLVCVIDSGLREGDRVALR
jgi:HlyD family secretion protein